MTYSECFPRGPARQNGKLQKARDGVALLAHISEVPVVPMAVLGTYEAWPKSRQWPRPFSCEVRFGEPLRFSRADYKADKSVLSTTTRTIMSRIAELAGEEYPW